MSKGEVGGCVKHCVSCGRGVQTYSGGYGYGGVAASRFKQAHPSAAITRCTYAQAIELSTHRCHLGDTNTECLS